MTKMTYTNTLTYTYDASRANAKYSINGGETYMNHGEYAECLAKAVLGYEPHKDANTRFDMGHDIPEMEASVKSWKCGLTDMKNMPKNFTEFVNVFFDSDPSKNFIWVDDYAETVDLYVMNRTEFRAFVEFAGSWDTYSEKVRISKSMNKIRKWFEEM